MELKLSEIKVGFIEDELIASQDDRQEVRDLILDWHNMRAEIGSVAYAAHMPKHYEHGLASWINQELYSSYIGAKVSPHIYELINSGNFTFPESPSEIERDELFVALNRWTSGVNADSVLAACREAAGVPDGEALLSWIKQMRVDNAKLTARNIELSAEAERLHQKIHDIIRYAEVEETSDPIADPACILGIILERARES